MIFSTKIYDLPSSLQLTQAQHDQCRWSAYNSELLLSSLLSSLPSASLSPAVPVVTTDPSEADFFFIPFFPSCFLFNCWVKAGWKTSLRCDVERDYILPVMNWVRSQPFWEARQGSDHIIIHPMDFIDGYFNEEARMAMNSSIYLVTVGDLRPKPYGENYRRRRDIVIPSSTHLINSYYLNPRDYVDEHGTPYLTPPSLEDSPPPTQPEIWAPTPTQPAKWGKRHKRETTTRTNTAIFRGGRGNPDEGEAYALGIRKLFFPSNSSKAQTHSGFSSLPLWDIAEWSENPEYAVALSRAKFGLVPPGYTLDTTRLWEYLAFGVVPVFIGAGGEAGQVMPFADDFSYADFSISIPRERAHELPRVLEEVSRKNYERLRKNVWEVGRLLVLEKGKGLAWKWISRNLCRLKA